MTTTPTTILTIDDETAIRTSFALYLSDFDYKVIEAENGRIGLDIIAANQPDLILVDLRMPEVDGLEVLKETQKRWPEIPVIVVSGTGEITDVIEALRLGAWDYILKPIEDMSILIHTIEKALERVELLRKDRAYQEVLEQEVKKQTAEVVSEKLISDAIINNLPGIFCLADSSYRLVKWNENLISISGYTTQELTDMLLPELLLAEDEDFLLADKKEVDLHILAKDGRQIPCLFSNQVLTIADERCFVGVGLDMTTKHELERELNQAQKMEAMGVLAGGIAHDFNNILSGIFGFAELAQMKVGRESDAFEYIKQVRIAADRARELVLQILTFSRKSEHITEPLQLSLIVKEALKLLRSSIPASINLKTNIRSNGLVMADAGQIHQIIMNLVTNAYQAIGHEVGIITVSLLDVSKDEAIVLTSGHKPDKSGECVLLEIKDSGCGMNAETLNSIFEPYFTTKEKGKGTGLGMAVVHGIVKKHNGTINVSSEPGKGSILQIFFNTVQRTDAIDIETTEPETTSTETARIMFVDDEEMLRQLVLEYLGSHNFKVDVFKNGIEALAVLEGKDRCYDLLITDLTMPAMPGDQLIDKARELCPSLPVILCSGYTDIYDRPEFKNLTIMKKPIVLSKLLCLVDKLLHE